MKTATEMVTAAKSQIESIDPQTAADELASGTAVMLDVREPVEWEHHIAGAVQVPRGLLEFVADPSSPRYNSELEPTSRVIVYCHSGARASLAAMTLKEMGYQNVANLEGGLAGWTAAGLATVQHHADI
jgi:rhodanese-related sulfurtransferase